jgi:SAM-dependent methyltransferase
MTTYDADFFEAMRVYAQDSAAAMVPTLYDLLEPGTVVDVGCGEGWWGKAFADRGADVLYVDGLWAGCEENNFIPRDLEKQELALDDRMDLAVCLEVAEHLSPERADSFVSELCAAAPTVLFSAAVPGQGGHGHVNEQWPRYWAERFEQHGYAVSGELRWMFWNDDRIAYWYRQNLLIASTDIEVDVDGTPGVVHPVGWAWHYGPEQL